MDEIQFGANGDESASPDLASDTSQLYHGFLNDIPEQDRAIVGKYVKQWDGNVTKQFQKIHDNYRPYKDLGDIERLQLANEFFKRFETDPLEVYRIFKDGLVQEFGEDFEDQVYDQSGQYPDDGEEEYYDEDGEYDDDDDYEEVELPAGVADFLESIGANVQDLVDWKTAQEAQAQEAYENEQLDSMLEQMHNTMLQGYKLDEDDDDWLLIQMSKGREPQEAAQAWIKKFGGQQSPPSRPVARILSGQGGVMNDQVDVTKLDANNRKATIAALLEQAGRD